MPIRVRLTFYYGVLSFIGLLAFSALFYLLMQNSLNTDLDADLRDRANDVLSSNLISSDSHALADLRNFLKMQGAPPQVSGTPGINIPNNQRVDLQRELAYVQVSAVDPISRRPIGWQAVPDNIDFMKRSEVQARLQKAAAPFLDPYRPITRGTEGRYDTFSIDNDIIRIYTQPVTNQSGLLGYVQVARSVVVIEDYKTKTFVALVVGTAVMVLLFLTAGVWLIRREFASLDAITRTAERISQSPNLDLTERIPPPSGKIGIGTRVLRWLINRRLRLDTSSEVSRLTDAFNAMLERIETSFRTQRQFTADSSHELRTPLTVIMGNVDLAKRNPDPRNQAESLTAIEKEAKRMQKLVSDLLLLAQADARIQTPTQNLVPIEMDSIVFDVFKQGRVLAAEKAQSLTLANTDVVRAIGDLDQIKRAVLNLVENAVKYTPTGGTITIGLARAGHEVRVDVRDTGIGIAPEDLPRIFDRFYRVDKARTRSTSGGTGLGLAIVKHIAESNGGRITVESEPGKGSTFSLWLRAADPDPLLTADAFAADSAALND